MNNRDFVISHWQEANRQSSASMRNRWLVGRAAYTARGKYVKGAIIELAKWIAEAQGDVIPDHDEKTPTDTVYRLANAYALFVVLLGMDRKRAKEYRRKYPYTRFDLVYKQFLAHEFDPSKLFDYLDYKGGNVALGFFIDNVESPSPEWERNANDIYKKAFKLQTDFGVPDGLQKAAVIFVKEFETWQQTT